MCIANTDNGTHVRTNMHMHTQHMTDGALAEKLEGHTDRVYGVMFHPTKPMLVRSSVCVCARCMRSALHCSIYCPAAASKRW